MGLKNLWLKRVFARKSRGLVRFSYHGGHMVLEKWVKYLKDSLVVVN